MKSSLYVGLNNSQLERKLGGILQERYPDWDIIMSCEVPGIQSLEDCQAAIVWKTDPAPLLNMPNLKLIQCMGAGVDFIDWSLPQYRMAPVCRFVDTSLSVQLAQYVIGYLLSDKLEFDRYRDLQNQQSWMACEPKVGNKVLILGLGVIGSKIASLLQQMDFQIYSWSTTKKGLDFITEMTTQGELTSVLPEIDYLVNLLPSTPKTANFINESFLLNMNSSACIINAGRGETIDDDALLSSLDQNKIRKAVLDVFKQEPLPSQHAFWSHPSVIVTPHVAAQSDLATVVQVFSRNFDKVICGESPDFEVDPDRGY